MSRGFAYCNEHLLHLLWFNVAGAHLGPPSTVSTPSARVFIPLGRVTDTGRRAGGCSNCKGSVLGLWAGCQTQQQQGHLIYALLSLSLSLIGTLQFSFLFIPHYLQFAISQLHLSPLLSSKPSTTNQHTSRETPTE